MPNRFSAGQVKMQGHDMARNLHSIKITQNADKSGFELISLNGMEQLSVPYRFQLTATYGGKEFKPDDIINQQLNLSFSDIDETGQRYERFIDGIVISYSKQLYDKVPQYRLLLVPKLYLLKYRSNYRIFQNVSVTDIISELFEEHKIQYKIDISGTLPKLEYCVQYRETDFNFISRLMEYAGIFYYFEHTGQGHTVILANTNKAYKKSLQEAKWMTSPGCPGVKQWHMDYQFTSGTWVYNTHDYTKPENKLIGSGSIRGDSLADDSYEHYEYSYNYQTAEQGEKLAGLRTDLEEAMAVVGKGNSTYCHLSLAGEVDFDPGQFPQERGKTYVITALSHRLEIINGTPEYTNTFSTILADKVYRPSRVTVKPLAPSTQLATIVGPNGVEIATDEYGRYQVQFYWARENPKKAPAAGDEATKTMQMVSCWMRSVQHWEGFLRVGTPVLIGFIDDDIDQPIILGPVYNDNLKPLYSDKADQNKSSIKRRFTKADKEKAYNEIILDDKPQNQKLSLYAGKNMETEVENNATVIINKGTYVLQVKGDVSIKTEGGVLIEAKKAISLKSDDNIELEAGKDLILKGKTIQEN